MRAYRSLEPDDIHINLNADNMDSSKATFLTRRHSPPLRIPQRRSQRIELVRSFNSPAHIHSNIKCNPTGHPNSHHPHRAPARNPTHSLPTPTDPLRLPPYHIRPRLEK